MSIWNITLKHVFKNKRFNFLVILGALIVILSTVFINSRYQHRGQYDEEIQLLRDIRFLNAIVTQELLRVRYQLFTDFTDLSADLDRLRAASDRLRQLAEQAGANLPQTQWLKLHSKLAEIFELIDEFKTADALLKNSLVVLPNLIQELKTGLADNSAHHKLSADADTLVRDLFVYSLVNDEHLDRHMQQQVDAMQNWLAADQPDLVLHVEVIYKNAKTILDNRGEADRLLKILSATPIDKLTSNLQQSFANLQQVNLEHSNTYRVILFLLCILLLSYTAFVLIKLKRNSLALEHEKNRALVTLHSIGDGIITTDAGGTVQYLNPVAEQLTGWTNAQASGKSLAAIFQVYDERSMIPVNDLVGRCIHANMKICSAAQSVIIDTSGKTIAIEDTVAPIRSSEGEIIGTIIIFRDVSHTRELSRKLSYQASHDSLTDVINRRTFEIRLSDVINRAKAKPGSQHALLYLDLDQFKIVNDTCGHDAGDQLLIQVTSLLQAKLGEHDTLARLGGDEFGILLQNASLTKAREFAERILQAIKQFRFEWQSIHFQLGVSIGVALIDHKSTNFVTALSAADMACYVAKDTGRNRVHIYTRGNKELVRRKDEMQWVSRLTLSFKENRFVLYKQPIVPICSSEIQVSRYELLLRLKEPDNNIILPSEFIPAAERYNFMPTLDRWVIHAAFSCARHDAENACYSINVSGTSLNSNTLLSYIKQESKKFRINPEQFCFEITETAAINNLPKTAKLIRELKALGFKFALDDFGTGLSSFTYLSKLPVDYLKIDGDFVRNLSDNTVNHAIIWSISNIGQMLGMQIIAEYVENDQIYNTLSDLGIEFAQGFKFGQPQPMENARFDTAAFLAPEKFA